LEMLLGSKFFHENSTNAEEQTCLHVSARKGLVENVKVCLTAGVDVLQIDRHGNTAAHFAASGNHSETLKLLIEKGCDMLGENYDLETPLSLLMEKNRDIIQTLNMLIDMQAVTPTDICETAIVKFDMPGDQFATMLSEWTPLYVISLESLLISAIEIGDATKVRILLTFGAAVNCSLRDSGACPLVSAVRFDQEEIIDILIDAGAGDFCDKMGISAVGATILALNKSLLQKLLLKGLKFWHGPGSEHLMQMAISLGKYDWVDLLISEGCPVTTLTWSEADMKDVGPAFVKKLIGAGFTIPNADQTICPLLTPNNLKVLSLTWLSRAVIRKSLKNNIANNVVLVGRLPIPSAVQRFILFADS
jgi:ankyrin repeat protein